MGIPRSESRARSQRTITLNFEPNEAQDAFIHTGEQKAAIVASVAAGKTTACVIRAWLISYKYPGNKGVLCRYTWDEIRNTVIPKIKECIPSELLVNPECMERQNLAQQTLLVRTADPERPSEMLFRNLEDFHKFESEELGWFCLFQANDPKIRRDMWDTLNERLRWPVPYKFAFLEANWGGNASTGGWIWDEFQDKKRGFLITADTMVNWKNLTGDYKKILADLPEYRRLHSIYGFKGNLWDPLIHVNGLPVYPEFKWGFHTPEDGDVGDVRKLFVPERPIVRGIDVPGPGACVWCQMDEKGRLLIGHELALDTAIGTSEFADLIQSETATFFPGGRFIDYIDPAALRVEQTSGKSNADVLREKGFRPMGAGVAIDERLEMVKDWLNMAVRGGAGLLIDPGCHRLIGGFQGGYFYERVGTSGGTYRAVPNKGNYSHIHDALQYAVNGVARLQRAAWLQNDDAPPMPTAWLGGMRRNLRPATPPPPPPEVVGTRSRRNIRVPFQRLDWD